MKDLKIETGDIDEELEFHAIDLNCFEVYARFKNHSLIIQPTMEDARRIRDWLDSLLVESEE